MVELGLFQNNTGLVYSCISHYFGKEVLKDEEIVQSGMVGLWKAIRSYDTSKGSLSTWAWIQIRKEVQEELKRRQWRGCDLFVSLEELTEKGKIFGYSINFEKRIFRKELREVLKQFLDEYLTEEEKEVIVRRFLYNDSFDEICNALELDKRRAYKLFERGMKKLREHKEKLAMLLGLGKGGFENGEKNS
ncbi:MAG: sigma-70 family RNA polymerase sigma factor [candidate division WOR-3 bacterium]